MGPIETGITLAGQGRDARRALHLRQAAGDLPVATLPARGVGASHPAERAAARGALQQAVTATEERTAQWHEDPPSLRVVPPEPPTPADEAELDVDGPGRGGHPGLLCHPWNVVTPSGGVLDVWYLDDNTVLTRTRLAADYLEAADSSSAARGGQRNRGKTIVTLYATDTEAEAMEEPWRLSRLRDFARVVTYGTTDKQKQLGVAMGGADRRCAQFRDKTRVVQAMHDKIRHIEHSATESVMSRACVGVAKITHLLQAAHPTRVCRKELENRCKRFSVSRRNNNKSEVALDSRRLSGYTCPHRQATFHQMR